MVSPEKRPLCVRNENNRLRKYTTIKTTDISRLRSISSTRNDLIRVISFAHFHNAIQSDSFRPAISKKFRCLDCSAEWL